jgi:branched-chain amino acid transport system substrate-binding protein
LLAILSFHATISLAASGQSAHLGNAQSLPPLRIGSSGPLSGDNATPYLELIEGAKLYFNEVNRAGGIHGRGIEYVVRDDAFDVNRTLENAKALIETDKVLALLLVRGTPHNEALLPLLNQHKLPLVAPSTGAFQFHSPVNKYVFNVRAPYRAEAKQLVRLLAQLGSRNIGIIYVDDSFGNDVLAGLEEGFAADHITPSFKLGFDRVKATANDSFMDELIPRIAAANPRVIIFIGAGAAVSNGVKKLRAKGNSSQIATISNNASGAFIKLMGEHAHGVLVSQVYPDERIGAIALIREAQALAAKANVKLSPTTIEGFVAAKVMAVALKQAGPDPTRQSLHAAMEEKLRTLDVGGLTLSYSKDDHTGFQHTDLSIIRNDHFRR